MIAIFATAGLFLAQAGTSLPIDDQVEQTDAAYEQLANGQAQAAIVRLEAALLENPGDPALLINLGSAYIGIGDLERAATSYRAAANSEDRYRLELADGQWVDSRTAARRALQTLEARGFALR
jgi:cytochrome c-type biogenesis protein CcmH/NrfG